MSRIFPRLKFNPARTTPKDPPPINLPEPPLSGWHGIVLEAMSSPLVLVLVRVILIDLLFHFAL
jgi:hypothetical protein